MKKTLKIKDIISTNSASVRSTVDHIFDDLVTNNQITSVCFDFMGINFISRSFAHEFVSRFNQFKNSHNPEIANTETQVEEMLELILKQEAGLLPEKNRSDLISDDFNPATASELFI